MVGKSMSLYGKTLLFKRGITIQISLLYECNLKCTYCSLEMPTGKRPKAKRVGLDEWKQFIKNFPQKIKEVYVSGGEPTLVKYLPELVNWLIGEGYHVILFTDLFNPDLILKIKKSYKFKIQSTYHHSDSISRFDNAVKKLKGYKLEVDEIGSQLLPYSKVKPFIDVEVLKDDEFRVSPDLQVFKGCYNHFVEKSK